MKKIRTLSIALGIILISLLVLNPNIAYAAETKRNLTYQKTRPYSDDNGDDVNDNEEYLLRRGETGNSDLLYSVVKIYDPTDSNNKFKDIFYCLRGGKGFGSVDYNLPGESAQEYTVLEDMKKNADSVISKYQELYNINLNRIEPTITFNGQTYNNVNIYNAILWIADNAYLPVTTEKYNAEEYKAELLTKIGVAKINQSIITDDDLEVIQQLAFWYFANYDENGKEGTVSVETQAIANLLNLKIDNNNTIAFDNPKEQKIRGNYLNRIYQYFIENAIKEGQKTDSTIRDTEINNSEVKFDKNVEFKVEKIEEDNGGPEPEKYYKIGPFKVTATNKRNNFEIALIDGAGNAINPYYYFPQEDSSLQKTIIFRVIDSTTEKAVDNLKYDTEYYIELDVTAEDEGEVSEWVDIDPSKFSLEVSQTNKWTTENFLYKGNEDQAVIEIKRDQETTKDTISTETPKRYDLALRKFITAIKRGETNVEVASRTPSIDTTTLINGITDRTGKKQYTATYTHSKDALTVETGDIVTYTIRVYNEGEIDGKATEVTDYLPEGLELVSGGKNKWTAGAQITLANGSKVTPITSTDLSNTTIKAFDKTKTSEATTGIWQKADKGEGGLYYADLEVQCKVVATASGLDQNLRNIAAITADDGDDEDSVPKKPDLDDYKPEGNNSTYQQDDDDYEDLKLNKKEFDLSLRKFITAIKRGETNVEVASRTPSIDTTTLINGITDRTGKKQYTATYTHSKDALTVETGDIVTYTIRVYNEGEIDGKATEVTDYLPEGLELVSGGKNKWTAGAQITLANGSKVTPITSTDLSNTTIKAFDKTKTSEATTGIWQKADKGEGGLYYADLEVQCKVVATASGLDQNLRNIAAITADDGDDEDSVPKKPDLDDYKPEGNNSTYQQDDDDYEDLKLNKKEFDLSLRKFISKVERINTETSQKEEIQIASREPQIKIADLKSGKNTTAKYVHPKNTLTLKRGDIITYTIRVYNEGGLDGYATEVKDYLPEGLELVEGENGAWTQDGDTLTTTSLKDKKLLAYNKNVTSVAEGTNWQKATDDDSGLYYYDLQVVCKIKDDVTDGAILKNVAEISIDKALPTDIDDRDSVPGNVYEDGKHNPGTETNGYTPGEQDDDDFEQVTVEPAEVFDLALRKYIISVNEKVLTNGESRVPNVDVIPLKQSETTADYKHKKDPVEVKNGDIVTYRFTAYNEGDLKGYVYSITDYLPEGLEFDAESNPKFIEAKTSGEYTAEELEGKEYIYSINEEKNTITISKIPPQEETGLQAYLFALDPFNGEQLDSESIDVKFKVTAEESGNDQVLTNVATMDYASAPRPQAEKVKDRDSESTTFTEPTAEKLLESLPGYKGNDKNKTDLTDSNYHYEGQQDDDDFEKIIIKGKVFDLALRKYIISVNDKVLTNGESRVPDVDVTPLKQSETTANYKHKKDPVEVKNGDIVTYRFTAYNEGDLKGYVYSITDYLPEGLEFDAESNPKFIEAKTSGEYTAEELEGKEYIYSINEEKNTITISKIPPQEETGLQAYLFALDPFNGEQLDSESIDVKFKVTAEESGNDQVLTNVATMDYASAPRPQAEKVKDRDSESTTFTEPTAEKLLESLPGYKGNDKNKTDLTDSNYHYEGQQDDDDFEKIIVKGKPFDLSLRKYITSLNGTKLEGDKDRTPQIDTTKLKTGEETTAIYKHPKNALTVRKGDIVTYKIRVYNEAQRDGYATLVTDYLPDGLGFLPGYTNNSAWSVPKVTGEDGKETLPEGVKTISLVGENGFYSNETSIDKNKIKLEDFKDPVTGEVPTDYSGIQIVTGERLAISTKSLEDKKIKAYKSEKAEGDLWQQSTNDENDGLFYQEVEITCIVLKENTYRGILKNVAEITGAKDSEGTEIKVKGDDRDSEPNNVYEDDKHTPKQEVDGYTPGEQDDDDFEQLQLKYFDLALRKFITKVDNEAPKTSREPVPDVTTLINGTYDRNGKKEYTATYNHTKDPLWVKNGSNVEYTIRVYNEGSEDGYAYEVSDDIPEGLVFDPENEINKSYGWTMYREMTEKDKDMAEEDIIEYNSKKYVVTKNAEEATMIRTRYLEKTLIKAFNPETKELSHADVKVVFTVKEPKDSEEFDKDRVIINQAQITEDSGNDEDSEPNKWQDEDDEDIEKIRIPIFDLSLLKWVTQSVVTVDGKTTTTNTGFKPNQGLTESTGEDIRKNSEAEPMAKVELDKKKLSKTVVKFVYKIRVTNEGEIPGYATEITDYIPEGLEFHEEDGNNKALGWVKSGDDKIITRALETTLLNPGESKEVEVTFRWINSEKNLGQKINIAEISEDANDYNTDDIDSTPNNKENPYNKEQEDDDDFALVILSIKTGATQFMQYFTIVTISVAILGAGVYLIKRYVLTE